MSTARVLIVDDDPEMLSMLRGHLEGEGFTVLTAAGGREGVAVLEREECDVIFTDLVMDDSGGMEILAAAQRQRPNARVILMTAFGSLETAIEAMRHGAYDYLTKPFKLAEVTLTVHRALEDSRLRRENQRLRAHVEQEQGIGRLLGQSPQLRAVLDQIRAVADS
ncbi:MAG: response regulator, partial [Deltaproteobacteria bacterium]|nr:response regulator [Deltaproteobacteria bacterium]